MRLTRRHDPGVRRAGVDDQRPAVPTRIRVSRVLAAPVGGRLDRDVEYHRGPRGVGCRVVAGPGRDSAMTRRCPTLPRPPVSMDRVARLSRFRWPIARCFKAWTSSAQLHQFDPATAHLAEGLLGASLGAAVLTRFLAHAAPRVGPGPAISPRRVARCAHPLLDELVTALLSGVGLLATRRRGLASLLANARRATLDRDSRTGRLRAGLTVVEAAK